MSREKPIFFNTDMVRAILEGRKTVTRRVVKPRYREDEGGFQVCTNKATGERWIEKCDWDEGSFDTPRYVNSPYRPGDILYVRKTYSPKYYDKGIANYWNGGNRIVYKADWDALSQDAKDLCAKPIWKPSIHMPREAARIFLRVTDVRVERLQDSFTKHGGTIFEIRAEGINIPEECRDCIDAYGSPCCIDTAEDDGSECGMLDYPRSDFADLWNSTIRSTDRERYGWAANPWVWVIDFARSKNQENSNAT